MKHMCPLGYDDWKTCFKWLFITAWMELKNSINPRLFMKKR